MQRAIADVSILSFLVPCRKTPRPILEHLGPVPFLTHKDIERLNSLEEVDICKLLHLLHIHHLDNLFVVE